MKKSRAPKRGKLLTDDIQSVVNRLTVDQIRYVFTKIGKTPEKGTRDKKSLIESLLTSGSDINEVQKIAFETESSIAPKHLFVGTYNLNTNFKFPNRHRVFGPTTCPNVKKMDLVYWDESEDYYQLTFQHQVHTVRWVQKDESTRKKEKETILHAVFVRLEKDNRRLFTVGYSGFENNAYKNDPNKVSYQQIVSDVIQILNDEIGVTTTTLPVKKAIDFLIQHNSTRVYREKGDPEFKFGKLTVQSKEGTKGIENVLVGIFANTKFNFNHQDLAEAAKDALKNSSMHSVVAVWVEEHLVSRIEFWDVGAEFLFVWKKTPQSYSTCFKIFGLIQETIKNIESSSDLMSVIFGFEIGKIFKASDIANNVSVENTKLKRLIVDALNLGLIIPIYRLNTIQLVQETRNEWTPDLSSLAKEYTLESGEIFDGKNPKNIEIAFLRSSELKQESKDVVL